MDHVLGKGMTSGAGEGQGAGSHPCCCSPSIGLPDSRSSPSPPGPGGEGGLGGVALG